MFSLLLLAVVATLFTDTIQHVLNYTGPAGDYMEREPCSGLRFDCQDWASYWGSDGDESYSVCPGRLYYNYTEPKYRVQCDMTGGNWTIVLKRFNGAVDFNRNWHDMEHTVGDAEGEYWLGLEAVHLFTTSGNYSMIVEIREGSHTWTEVYDSFTLSREAQKYNFRAEGFDRANSSNTEPRLGQHSHYVFSTYDQENSYSWGTQNCATRWKGPGWYSSICGLFIHPFGQYNTSGWWGMKWRIQDRSVFPTGIIWKIKRRQ